MEIVLDGQCDGYFLRRSLQLTRANTDLLRSDGCSPSNSTMRWHSFPSSPTGQPLLGHSKPWFSSEPSPRRRWNASRVPWRPAGACCMRLVMIDVLHCVHSLSSVPEPLVVSARHSVNSLRHFRRAATTCVHKVGRLKTGITGTTNNPGDKGQLHCNSWFGCSSTMLVDVGSTQHLVKIIESYLAVYDACHIIKQSRVRWWLSNMLWYIITNTSDVTMMYCGNMPLKHEIVMLLVMR